MKIRQAATVVGSFIIAGLVVACGSEAPSLEDMPSGTSVTIRTDDGTLVRGQLEEVGGETVVLSTERGTATTQVERTAIQSVTTAADQAPEPIEVTVPTDTSFTVSLESAVASNSSAVGDQVRATLSNPVTVDGYTVMPAGSVLTGRVTAVDASGNVSGRAMLEVQFDRLQMSGVTHSLQTNPIRYVAEQTRREDATTIGIGAGIGALIGGIAGGGQGAAIGSVIGAGSGTAVVLSTPGDEVTLSSGTVLDVNMTQSFTAVMTEE